MRHLWRCAFASMITAGIAVLGLCFAISKLGTPLANPTMPSNYLLYLPIVVSSSIGKPALNAHWQWPLRVTVAQSLDNDYTLPVPEGGDGIDIRHLNAKR